MHGAAKKIGVGPPAIASNDLVNALRSRIDDVLRAHLPVGTAVAHVGFPNSWNAGDSAIWLGTQAVLKRLGCRVVYQCAWQDYDQILMAQWIGGGVILVAGGGNLGDLYPNHQRFREQILRDFPDNPVLQLPQSMWFEQVENLEQFRRVCAGHSHFHILLRDQQSMDLAAKLLDVPVTLSPDMAFGSAQQRRLVDPVSDILWLSRTDEESLWAGASSAVAGVEPRDWLKLAAGETGYRDVSARLNGKIRRLVTASKAGDCPPEPVLAELHAAYDELAWIRARRGLEMLSSARVVITDRLHGHILSLCLGIPHVVMDNCYRKIGSTLDTWTSGSAITDRAESPEQAVEQAKALLRTIGGPAGG